MEPLLVAITLLLLLIGYVLPSIVAIKRSHNNRLAIIVLNILFAWSFVAWAIALIWACTDNTEGY